ncbi:PRD domain-containing protein [Clostridioides difficile]|nr:PRD domain-containing protein [Clostridioides difficile]
MKIIQILNNNVALVKRGKNEIIVFVKGIGFKKRVGQVINEDEIERTYILDSYDMLEHFSYLLQNSDSNNIVLINEIIEYGEKVLNIKSSDYLSLTLLDHLEFLLKRCEKNQFIKSPLVWNVKRFYPKHFEIGMHALKLIGDSKKINLPDDEAVSIALHFVNMEVNKKSHDDTVVELRTLGDIISIIKYHFNVELNETSTNYMRFTTHLQYFIQRIMSDEASTDEDASIDLYKQVSKLYPKSFGSVQKIRKYVKSQFNVDISISEETYLMLHINRVTQRLEAKSDEV